MNEWLILRKQNHESYQSFAYNANLFSDFDLRKILSISSFLLANIVRRKKCKQSLFWIQFSERIKDKHFLNSYHNKKLYILGLERGFFWKISSVFYFVYFFYQQMKIHSFSNSFLIQLLFPVKWKFEILKILNILVFWPPSVDLNFYLPI